MKVSDQTPSPERRTIFACGAIFASLPLLSTLGHDGREVAQLLALASPAIAWLVWPVKSAFVHRLRSWLVWAWAMSFATDATLRAYLLDTYRASQSSVVVSAAANTKTREAWEYLLMNWGALLLWAGVLTCAGVVFGRYVQRGARDTVNWPYWAALVFVLAVLVSTIAFASKPWRRLHPLLYWTQWSQSIDDFRTS